MGVGHQLKLTGLEEVGERFVKAYLWMTFQNEVDIQVVGSKYLAVLSNRHGAKGHLPLRQVAFDLSLIPVQQKIWDAQHQRWGRKQATGKCDATSTVLPSRNNLRGGSSCRRKRTSSKITRSFFSGGIRQSASSSRKTRGQRLRRCRCSWQSRGLAAAVHSLADDQSEAPQFQFCQAMIVIKQNVWVSSHQNRNPHSGASFYSLSVLNLSDC